MWKKAISNYIKSFALALRFSAVPTVVAFGLCFGTNAMVTLIVWLQSKLVEQISQADANLFVVLLAVFSGTTVIYKFRGYIVLPVEVIIDNKAALNCMERLMRATEKLPLKGFYGESLNVRLFRAKEQIDELQTDVMIFADTMACTFSMITFILMMCNYPRGGIYICLGMICTVLRKLFVVRTAKYETSIRLEQAAERRKREYYFQMLTDKDAIFESRFYEKDNFLVRKWTEQYQKVMWKNLSVLRWKTKLSYVTEGFAEMTYGLALVLLCLQVIGGEIEIGAFTYLSSATLMLSLMLERVIRAIERAYMQGASKEDFISMISISNGDDEPSVRMETQNSDCAYEMRHVDFSYESGEPVLRDLSLCIKKDELVALVGPNGCGKSTLVNLLLGLFEPDAGTVFFCGSSLEEMPLVDRVHAQSAVFQDYVRYHFTLRENIGFGKLDLLDDDVSIAEAAQQSGCGELLNNDRGLDVYLNREFDDYGIEPSLGQWQRIAISRALIGNRKHIFFDEPSAAIDPLAELELFEQIKSCLDGKCGMIVTHRIGIAQLANRILYMENGQIQESGTHEELIALGGSYARMYKAQAQWYFDDKGSGKGE